MDLTVFVPSRGRPNQIVGFASDFFALARGNTRLVIVLDEDDWDLARYKAKIDGRYEVYVAKPTRRGMVGALNGAYRAYERLSSLGFAVGFMGDDHVPRTEGWDVHYVEALRGLGTGFVYGDDLFQGEAMPTQVAFTSDIARSLSYMSPPELDHLCVDLVWKEWGLAIDAIKYLPEVVVEHMHPLAGKGRYDKAYKAVNSNLMARHDSQAYREYMENGRFAEDVGRIKMIRENGYFEPR